jgi:porin
MLAVWLPFVMANITVVARADTAIDAFYRADFLYNHSGGIETGSTYLDDAVLTFETDLEDRFGMAGATSFVSLLWNNNNTFSDQYVGDLQVISNIDAEKALRIYELWYEQPVADSVTLRFGLYDLNSEFDAIDTSGLFINSSHGIGADYGQSGQNGPSIFPVTSLTARFDWQISGASNLRYAILDGVPGDPDDPSKTTIDLGDGDGVLHALEFNQVLASGTRVGVGTWLYSANFDRIDGNGQDGGNAGFYGFVDMPLKSVVDDGFGLAGFLRYGTANDEINVLGRYFGGGVVATGLIRSRPDDQIGFAIASARVGDPFQRAADLEGAPADSHETNIELTYSTHLNDWLRIQPNIQYVINPGADKALGNAFVFGIRFEVSASSR